MSTMNTKNLDLYVVDDDEAVRHSLLMKLALRGNRVQAFSSGEAFLASADLQRGGCAIVDMHMPPGMNGMQVLDALLACQSPIVTLFLSGTGTIPLAVEATEKGAFGWLEKSSPDVDAWLDKIDGALGKAALVAGAHRARHEAGTLWNRLTPSEEEVARLVATGLANKLVARALTSDTRKVGVRTIEKHRSQVYAKLDISSAAELDRFIRDNGL